MQETFQLLCYHDKGRKKLHISPYHVGNFMSDAMERTTRSFTDLKMSSVQHIVLQSLTDVATGFSLTHQSIQEPWLPPCLSYFACGNLCTIGSERQWIIKVPLHDACNAIEGKVSLLGVHKT